MSFLLSADTDSIDRAIIPPLGEAFPEKSLIVRMLGGTKSAKSRRDNRDQYKICIKIHAYNACCIVSHILGRTN